MISSKVSSRLFKLRWGLNGSRSFSISNNVLASRYESVLPETFYNEEQLEMQKTFRTIIERDINPYVDEWEKAEEAPLKSIFKKLGDAGLLGVTRPVEYGGLGLSYKYQAAVLEEAGTINCGGIPMAIAVQTDIALPALTKFGTDELKKEFLTPTIRGDYVVCLGVSEPSAGSDVASIKTTAVRKGDDYIINGQKMWITNSLQADWMCILVNTSTASPYKNKSLICLPMNLKGITKSKIDKIGMNSSDTGLISFQDVRVPCKNIIGDEGAGFFYQMLQFQEERLAAVIVSLRALDLAIHHTIEYTTQRKVFGVPIIDNQVVHFRMAELATESEALRALCYTAINAYSEGEDVTRLASMIKLKAGRLLREVSDSCMQYWGGMGYTRENVISRMYRDTRLMSIGGGADEVMLSIICKLIGILPKGNKPK